MSKTFWRGPLPVTICDLAKRLNLSITQGSRALEGYQQGLSAAGLKYDEHLVMQSDLTEDGGYLAASILFTLADFPTAILECNDQVAIGVLHVAKEAGRKVGQEFAVASYDGIREGEFCDPPLTTLSQPTYDLARKLVQMLVAVINHNMLNQPRIVVVPGVILRASTEA
jgi:DNA-binding LacI/PurR family transcriptional regulator